MNWDPPHSQMRLHRRGTRFCADDPLYHRGAGFADGPVAQRWRACGWLGAAGQRRLIEPIEEI
jgi:hypothetical protein